MMRTLREKIIQPNKVGITIVQLLFPVAVFWGIGSSAEWYWWLVAFLFYFLYCAVGNNLAMHRYYCHKHFELSKPMEYFFLWCSSMSILGSPLSYAIPHLMHHKNPDCELDPHGPTVGLKSLLYFFHRHLQIDKETLISRRVIELTRRYGWLHKNYYLFVIANVVIMSLISWKVVLFCWLIPAGATLWAVAVAIYLQHIGYKPSNNAFYSWFGWGEGLHANHHIFPGKADTALKPGETDWTYQLSRVFAKKFYE
jgi:stearoyl-CoA desaturase (delta-9 desaturase)